MKSYDDYLDRTHDEAYASYYGHDGCDECDCAPCQCEEDFDIPDEPDIDEDVCFGGVDW